MNTKAPAAERSALVDQKHATLTPSCDTKNGLKSNLRRAIGSLLCLVVFSCVAPPQDFPPHSVQWEMANPELEGTEQLLAKNARHRVLVSVIDAGIDSSHPRLRGNLHPFEVSAELHREWNVPMSRRTYGYGLDLIGKDFFPNYAVIGPYEAPEVSPEPTPSPVVLTSLPTRRTHSEASGSNSPSPNPTATPAYVDISFKLGTGTHGTHVSQLATLGNPAIGLIPVRVLPTVSHEGDQMRMLLDREGVLVEQLIEFLGYLEKGLDFAVSRGAHVASMSLGASLEEITDLGRRASVETFVREHLLAKMLTTWSTTLMVIAAGNERTLLDRPGLSVPATLDSPDILSVGALTKDRRVAHFSNLSRYVDVYMAGTDIASAVPVAYGRWERESGTSMATPLVANLAAQIKLIRPELTASELRALILNTARVVDAPIQAKPSSEGSPENPAGNASGNSSPALPEKITIRIADFKAARRAARRLGSMSQEDRSRLLTPPYVHGQAPLVSSTGAR